MPLSTERIKHFRSQLRGAHEVMKPGQRYSVWLLEGTYVIALPEDTRPRTRAKHIGLYTCDIDYEDLVADFFDLE